MYLTLEETDRIVMEYRGPATPAYMNGHRIVLAAGPEALDTETFVVLWELRSESPDSGKWQLVWRGDWKSSAKVFTEYVGDIDSDAMVEIQNIPCSDCGGRLDSAAHNQNIEGSHTFVNGE